MSNELAKISAKELALVDDNVLNAKQLQWIFKRTPQQYIKARPAKGGGSWNYVSGSYVRKVLNLMFGFDWSFEILEQHVMHGEAIVKGKLTCTSNGRTIVKMQFGNKDIAYKTEKVFNDDGTPKMITDRYGKEKQETRPSETPLSIGNDLKAAATDALKKCAAELGIAADVYNPLEFREINVDTSLEDTQRTQEYDRIKYHIENSQDVEELMMVSELYEANNLAKEYAKKLQSFYGKDTISE